MAPSKIAEKPKPILRNVVVAKAGTLEGDMTDGNLTKWMQNYGGRFSADLDDSVTHLLATTEQYKKKVAKVKQALAGRKVEIVNPNWIMKCMFNNQKVSLDEYSYIRAFKKARAEKARKERKEKGIERGEHYVNDNNYGYYFDKENFEYMVTLTKGEEGERMIIELWESYARPELYLCSLRYYKKSKAKAITVRVSQNPHTFTEAFTLFRGIFLKKTGVSWNRRVEEADENGQVTGKGDSKSYGYSYQLPMKGKPVGAIWKDPDAGTATSTIGKRKGSSASEENGAKKRKVSPLAHAPLSSSSSQIKAQSQNNSDSVPKGDTDDSMPDGAAPSPAAGLDSLSELASFTYGAPDAAATIAVGEGPRVSITPEQDIAIDLSTPPASPPKQSTAPRSFTPINKVPGASQKKPSSSARGNPAKPASTKARKRKPSVAKDDVPAVPDRKHEAASKQNKARKAAEAREAAIRNAQQNIGRDSGHPTPSEPSNYPLPKQLSASDSSRIFQEGHIFKPPVGVVQKELSAPRFVDENKLLSAKHMAQVEAADDQPNISEESTTDQAAAADSKECSDAWNKLWGYNIPHSNQALHPIEVESCNSTPKDAIFADKTDRNDDSQLELAQEHVDKAGGLEAMLDVDGEAGGDDEAASNADGDDDDDDDAESDSDL